MLLLKSDTAVRSFSQSVLSTGILSVTFRFDVEIPILTLAVSASAPYATYQIDSASNVSVGDVVSISMFGNKPNNGSFLVLEKSDNYITVLNSAAVTENKGGGSTGTRETSKNIDLFILT